MKYSRNNPDETVKTCNRPIQQLLAELEVSWRRKIQWWHSFFMIMSASAQGILWRHDRALVVMILKNECFHWISHPQFVLHACFTVSSGLFLEFYLLPFLRQQGLQKMSEHPPHQAWKSKKPSACPVVKTV